MTKVPVVAVAPVVPIAILPVKVLTPFKVTVEPPSTIMVFSEAVLLSLNTPVTTKLPPFSMVVFSFVPASFTEANVTVKPEAILRVLFCAAPDTKVVAPNDKPPPPVLLAPSAKVKVS